MTQNERQADQQAHVQPGISRRDVMKGGALVGGAMVWATPVVQTMAHPAFAAEGTPEGVGMSWAAFTFLHDGQYHGFKVDAEALELEEPGATPCCEAPAHWDGGDVANALDLNGVSFSVRQSNNCLVVGGFPAHVDTVHYAAMNAGGDTDSQFFDDSDGCGSSSSEDALCAKGTRTPTGPNNEITICDDEES